MRRRPTIGCVTRKFRANTHFCRTNQGNCGSVTKALPGGFVMIVCSCNVFTDEDVRATLAEEQAAPRTAIEVYGCLGCSAQCGRCLRTIRRIMDEALVTIDRRCYQN